MIYADHAATTKLDQKALDAMIPFFLEDYANASEPYSFGRAPKAALKAARARIAECINAEPDEIYITSCGTESDNWVIKGIGKLCKPLENIITSQIEHHAILRSCAKMEEAGIKVHYLPVDKYGVVQVETLKKAITPETHLVSVMFSNNEIGTIQPIKELCEVAHANGALFHTDAVQAIGHTPIDVKELGVDMLSASAHKFNGPKGIGFLYIKKGVVLPSFVDGGGQEFAKRAGTENVASIVGMSVALHNNCEGLEEHVQKMQGLEKLFRDELSRTGLDYIINGSDLRIPGNISVSFKNASGEMLLHRLDLMGICISTGSACNSEETVVSHVLQAINVPKDYVQGTIRISLGLDNDEEDVIKIVSSLKKILGNN